MINVCDTIIATLPFIIPIMPSIAAGSVIGFGGGLPRFSGSPRKLPSFAADEKCALRDSKDAEEMEWLFVRRLAPRMS
jgi:hypothetical protein